MSMANSFVELFSDMTIAPASCLIIGVMFVIIELYQSSKGVMAGIGVLLIITGITLRMVSGPHFGVFFLLVLGAVFPILVAHILLLVRQKKPWLVQSLQLALNNNLTGEDVNYNYLVDLIGESTTDINQTGSITINDVTFLVASSVFIEKNSKVRVVEVDNDKIFVEKINV